MGKRVKMKAGDIFRFQGSENLVGVGQVIEPGGILYATILRPVFSDPINVDDVPTADILLCGWTMGALFFHDRWHVIGNRDIPEASIPYPCSKVRIGEQIWIQDHRGRPLRKADAKEAELLDYHRSRAPIGYVNAFEAHHGCGEWLPRYDELRIERSRELAAICAG